MGNGLYGFTGNTSNVAVSNTPGLYIGSGNVQIFNSAQTLYNLLSNSSSIGWELVNTNQNVTGIVLPSGVTSGTYGNSISTAQITVGADGRITNISNVALNVTGTYSNANVASYLAAGTDPTIIGINSNVTTVQNNLTAFETYANVHFGTSSYGNSNVQAYLSDTNILYIGNSAGASSQVVIGDSANGDSVDLVASGALFSVGSVGGNLSVSTSNGIWIENTDLAFTNVSGQGGNINMNQTSGKGFINNANVVNAQSYVSTNGYFWANGAVYTGSSSTYGNANVALLLSSYNIPVDAISFTTNGVISTSDSLNTTFGAGQPTGSIQAPFGGIGIGLDAYIKGNANVGNLQSAGSITTTTGVFWANGTVYGSSYGNTQVAAYLLTNTGNIQAGNVTVLGNLTVQGNIISNNYDEVITGLLIANSTTVSTSTTTGALQSYGGAGIQGNVFAGAVYTNTYNFANGTSIFTAITSNAGTLQTEINSINANLGAFEIYSNANVGSIYNHLNTLDANVGSYEVATNANIGTIYNHLNTLDANVGSYEIATNANIGTIYNHLNTLNANVGAFETYANATFATSSNLTSFETYANTTFATATNLTNFETYANTQIATINANLGAFETYANATFSTGGTYGNANVSVYLPHATGYTGGWQMPIGGNSARPSFAANGMIRYNSDIQNPEWYNGVNSTWYPFSLYFTPAPSSYSASYLIVAGGAGGGTDDAGGGGAGGLLTGTTTLSPGTTYSFTVGGGGGAGSNGSNSTGFSLTAIGGGAGANGSLYGTNGTSGGSGGGGSADFYNLGPGTVTSGGSGTSGQGNAGGTGGGYFTSGAQAVTGGGGGAGAVGGNGSGSAVGNGGAGYSSSITGSATYYAGGGGGAGNQAGGGFVGGTGGVGGGGTGGYAGGPGSAGRDGYPGTANTGGGGGGGGGGAGVGGAGGSGVVILSVPTSNYSGTTTGSPTITTSGSNTIITFTSSGSYTA